MKDIHTDFLYTFHCSSHELYLFDLFCYENKAFEKVKYMKNVNFIFPYVLIILYIYKI